eukprot:347094-Pyramimonas_sp.AAC.1
MVHALGCEAFCVVSLCLVRTEGLSEGNLEIAMEVGAFLSSNWFEFVVCGDWNLAPEVLQDSDFDKELSCQIVALGMD